MRFVECPQAGQYDPQRRVHGARGREARRAVPRGPRRPARPAAPDGDHRDARTRPRAPRQHRRRIAAEHRHRLLPHARHDPPARRRLHLRHLPRRPFTCMQEGVATAKIEAMVKEFRKTKPDLVFPIIHAFFGDSPNANIAAEIAVFQEQCYQKRDLLRENARRRRAPESRHPGGKSQAPNPKSQTNPNFQILMTKTRVPALRGVTRSFGGSTRRSSRARLPPQSAIAVPAHGHRPRSCPGAAASTCSLSPPCARS